MPEPSPSIAIPRGKELTPGRVVYLRCRVAFLSTDGKGEYWARVEQIGPKGECDPCDPCGPCIAVREEACLTVEQLKEALRVEKE